MSRTALPVAALLLACDPGPAPESGGAAPSPAPAGSPAKPAAGSEPTAATPAAAAPTAELGQPAPDFSLPDLDGKAVRLADQRGKTVVLEWFNPECPFVKYAHGEGPLKTMAKEQTADGIVWLAINSGAPGKQGHGADKNRSAAESFGMAHPILLDESGDVGRAYGAKTTPHLFIVDPQGKLVFRGGVDNAPHGEVEGGGPVRAHALEALGELAAGKPVSQPDVRPYGCSVKYAS